MTNPAPDRETQRALVAEAARAPTVHNVQPARWRFLADGRVVLYRAVDRALPVADPTGHDLRVSLGAAWEGMSIALSRRGLGLSDPEFLEDAAEQEGRIAVASAGLVDGATPDPLADFVEARRSYRGKFLPLGDDVLRRLTAIGGEDVRWMTDAARLPEFARLYDEAGWSFVRQPAYHEELYRWMRLSPAHPDWARDGLNAECMALSGVERAAASVLLRPRVFGVLKRVGAARAVVSEAAQIRSASAILLFTPRREVSDFTVGRLFYRVWLQVASVGAGMVPMSALADSPAAREQLSREHGVPEERRLANVFRVGAVPPGAAARSPRLPVDELLV
jgi:nitroreductase